MSEIYAAALGLLIGSVLTAAGFLYKRRLENLSRLHEALFQLLELYGAIRMSAPVSVDQNLEWYFEVAQEMFPEEPISENKDKLKADLLPVILEALMRVTEVGDTDLLNEYKSAITRLATIAPVLAYRLSVNRSLKSALSQVDQYNDHVREILLGKMGPEEKDQLEFIINTMRKRISTDVASTLRKDIVILSMRCGLLSFFAIIKSLFFTRAQTMEEIMKGEYRWMLLEVKKKAAGES